MADRARRPVTGEMVDMSRIRSGDVDSDGPWEGMSCAVRIVPVACGEGRCDFAVHSRARERHREDCNDDTRVVVTALGRHRQIERAGSAERGMLMRLRFLTAKSRSGRLQ